MGCTPPVAPFAMAACSVECPRPERPGAMRPPPRAVAERHRPSAKQIEKYIAQVDGDQDGKLDEHEYLELLRKARAPRAACHHELVARVAARPSAHWLLGTSGTSRPPAILLDCVRGRVQERELKGGSAPPGPAR